MKFDVVKALAPRKRCRYRQHRFCGLASVGNLQAEFARQFMLNLRTLQDWEQGRREPEDIARAYLRVIERNPDAVRAALED
jgi:hypothetical protein